MSLVDIEALKTAATADPEFMRAMRYYDGSIRLSVGDREDYIMIFEAGRLQAARAARPGDVSRISVSGTEEHWDNLLQLYPKPFYQCLQSSAVKHGMILSETNESFAYLPALNRMVQLLRNLRRAR